MKYQKPRRLQQLSESVTLKLNARVKELQASGADVVNLTAGEPDFAPPMEVLEATLDAVRAKKNKYTPVQGIRELCERVARKTVRQQPGLKEKWSADHVVVSNGGKHALFNTMLALIDEGDEVVIPAPYWLSYPEMVRVAGGVPVAVETTLQDHFLLQPEVLRAALNERTRMLILNSPSNPTGAVYSEREFEALGEVLKDFPNVWIVSDEIYDRIHYGEPEFCSFLKACPELQDRTVTVNGMSKAFALTGWRVGWSVCQKELRQAIVALQGQSTSGINILAQEGSVAGLDLDDHYFDLSLERYRSRRDLCLEILGKSGKLEVFPPRGAFYAFVGVGQCLRDGETAVGFAERLLEAAQVAVVPGDAFGDPRSVRISFAVGDDVLKEGCKRLIQFVEESQI